VSERHVPALGYTSSAVLPRTPNARRDFWRSTVLFATDFAAISGRTGVWALLYALGAAVLDGISISLLVPILGLLFETSLIPPWVSAVAAAAFRIAGAHSQTERLLLLLSLFGGLVLVRAAIVAARDTTSFDIQLRFIEEQRLRLTAGLTAARWDYVTRLRHARVTHLISGDIQRLGVGIQFILLGASAAAMLVAQFVLAMIFSPILSIVLILLLVAGSLALRPALSRARALGGQVTDSNLLLLDSTSQFLSAIKIAISQNQEGFFVSETRAMLREIGERQSTFTRRHIRVQALMTLLFSCLGAGLVLAGVGWLHLAPPVLITLLLLVSRMTGPAWQVQNAAHQFASVLSIHERIRELGAELAGAARHDKLTARAAPNGQIRFERVSFEHETTIGDGRRGVVNVDFTIEPGEFVALKGRSGSGKTTVVDLLVGLLAPQTGRITVGGTTLAGETLTAWRCALSYVAQEPFLFHDTVRRNLSWSGVSEIEMWEALELSGAARLVRSMDNGLDTVVGDRGTLVSGGERQRIALARALLRRPTLLVLDEATGALDLASERMILENLRAMKQRPTIVLISHRLENLLYCDRLLDLDNGRL